VKLCLALFLTYSLTTAFSDAKSIIINVAEYFNYAEA
jgi:hypothetical protein